MNTNFIHTNKRRPQFLLIIPCLLVMGALLFGCDPVTRHKTLTTVFDGVPNPPPVEKLCEEYMGDKYREFYAALDVYKKKVASTDVDGEEKVSILSSHRPYAEKNCEGCHDFKRKNLLLQPKDKLCVMCHKNFIQGNFVHGPVAVGDCLGCHLPHDSKNPALLQRPKNEICSKCHQEKRLAENMHIAVIQHNMFCVDCHDPHSGNVQYFLK